MNKRTLIPLLLGATLLTSCGGNATNNQSVSGGIHSENVSHLNFGCYNYSDSIDPVVNVNSSWCGVRYGITECLFKFDDKAVPQPFLVSEFSHSDDYMTWTFTLKEGVKFSNGNEVTATEVKNSFDRLFKETDSSQGGTGNSNPEGYFTYKEIVADDATNQVTITCTSPVANLPGILAYPYFAILDTSVIEDGVIGTGPYELDAVNTGVSLELSRNEQYHDGTVPFDTVTIVFINDSSTKSMALQSGDVDVVENITTPSDLEKLSNDPSYHVSTAAGVRTGNSYMNFNGVLKNEVLRQAMIMAIDNQTLCDVVVGGMYTNGFSVLPSSLDYGYDTLENPYSYDVVQAVKLLDEAGIVDTDGDGWREIEGKNIDLEYLGYTGRNLDDFAQAIAITLAEIEIKVTVNIRDYDTALALQNAGEFDLITSNSITVGTGDPQDFLGNWYSPNAVNYGYYKNTQYDEEYELLMTETDPERRKKLVIELQQILVNDAVCLVHGYYNSRMFSRADSVAGAEIATMDYYWITSDMTKKGGK